MSSAFDSVPFQTDRRAVWAMQLTGRRALEVVVREFERAGLDVLAVKGIVTAYVLYRDPTERPMGDVDLRIRTRDFHRAASVARDQQWEIAEWKPAYRAFVLFVRGLGVSVDIECGVGGPGFCALSVDTMLSRSTRGLGEMDVQVPDLHDHALVLCVNVFKDKLTLASPHALMDVERIAEVAGFDEDLFVERAVQAKVASTVWIVADWMQRKRGSAAWRRIRDKLGGDRGPRPTYARVYYWLGERAPSAMATRLITRIAADDPRMWMEALKSTVGFQWARSRRLDQPERAGGAR